MGGQKWKVPWTWALINKKVVSTWVGEGVNIPITIINGGVIMW